MNRFKYGRTYHFPFSKGLSGDDKLYDDPVSHFSGKKLAITVKMDGENSCLYQDGYTHARSIDSKHHISREWLKQFWAERNYLLPVGWRVYGENLYAVHSIEYKNLPSYFNVFAIYNNNNERLSWSDMEAVCKDLDMVPVTTLSVIDTSISKNWMHEIETIFNQVVENGEEGIVVTTVDGFKFEDMSKNVIKAVRKNHVQTEDHWMHRQVIKNGLKNEKY